MEKLSGILPSSPRIRSVDMDEAPPARPGAPAYGKRAGRNTVTDRVTMSSRAKMLAAQDLTGRRDPKEVARSKIAEDLSRNFFETRLQKPQVSEPTSGEKVLELTEMAAPDIDPTASQALKAYEQPIFEEPTQLLVAEA